MAAAALVVVTVLALSRVSVSVVVLILRGVELLADGFRNYQRAKEGIRSSKKYSKT